MFIQAIFFISCSIAIKSIIELYTCYNLKKLAQELEETEELLNTKILELVTKNPFVSNLDEYKTNIIAASDANNFLE